MADKKGKQTSGSLQRQRLQETFRLKAEKIKLQRREESNSWRGENNDRVHPKKNQADHGGQKKLTQAKPAVAKSKIPVKVTTKVSKDTFHEELPKQPQHPVTLTYDWAKKGRIQELKIRYLARKYLYLWKQNLTDPLWQKSSIARQHYKQTLLTLTFGVWKNLWWTQRKEWSLAIRAEYHYKYHLYLKVWRAWQVYVVRNKVKKAKTSVAVVQANYGTLGRHLKQWKLYHQERCRKQEKKRQAAAFCKMKMLHHFFVSWCHRIEEQREDQEAKSVALNHWAGQLTQKVFVGWKHYLISRREKKKKERKAVEFYKKSLLAKCLFQGFLTYIYHRRDRQQAKGFASQSYLDQLVYKSFHQWHGQLVVRRCMAQKQEEILNLGRRSRMRRILQQWKYYVKLCYDDRQNHRLAVLHHEKTLLRLGFSSLRLEVVRSRLKVLQKEEAENFHEKQVLKCAWRRWTERMEEIEEDKMKKETERAREIFRVKSLRITMDSWKSYWRWRRLRRNEYIMAEAHYVRKLCFKSLNGLALNVEYQKVKREDAQLAEQFYRGHVLSVTFNLWWRSYQLSLDRRMMERMAILHHQRKSLQWTFVIWKESLRNIISEQENMDFAYQHYVSHLCRKHLHQWQEVVKEAKQSNANDLAAVQYYYSNTARKVWNAWRKYVSQRRHKHSIKVKAADYHSRKLLQLVLNRWKIFHADEKKRLTVVEAKYSQCMKITLAYAFKTWRSNAKEHAKVRLLGAMAVNHRQSHMVQTVFNAWHQYAVNHAIKVTTKEQKLTAASQHLNKMKLKRTFCYWRQRQKESTDTRKGMYIAVRHHNRKVLQGALYQWKEFRKLQTKKMLLQRQSVWLHSTRIQAKFFLLWRVQYHVALQEHSQTTVALWHWSLVLQHKVLNAWYRYILDRRRKKKRIEGALAARHKRLLQEGLRQWMITADTLSERRIKNLTNQKTKETMRVFQVVQKCVVHWRRKTVEHRDRVTRNSEQTGYSRSNERQVELMSTSNFILPSSSGIVQSHEGLISRPPRPRPKRPDFLRDSLQNAGLWESPSKSSLSSSESPSGILPDKTASLLGVTRRYEGTTMNKPPAVFPKAAQSVRSHDMEHPFKDSSNKSQDSPLQDSLLLQGQGAVSSYNLQSGRLPVCNNGLLSQTLTNEDYQQHDIDRNVQMKESVKRKPPSSKKLLPPSAFMNTNLSQLPESPVRASSEDEMPKKYADGPQSYHKVLISPEMLQAAAASAREVAGKLTENDALLKDEVGFANSFSISGRKVLLSPKMIIARRRFPSRDDTDERKGHTNARNSTGSDSSEESVEYSKQDAAYSSFLQSKSLTDNRERGRGKEFYKDVSESSEGEGEKELGRGTSDEEMRKEGQGMEQEEMKEAVMELKSLLLKYQKHKDEVSILEDQKKAMEFLLEELVSPEDGDYFKETASDEYKMVLSDLHCHSQTLEILKAEISTMMAKLNPVAGF